VRNRKISRFQSRFSNRPVIVVVVSWDSMRRRWAVEFRCHRCHRSLQRGCLLLTAVHYAGVELPSSLWAFVRRRWIPELSCRCGSPRAVDAVWSLISLAWVEERWMGGTEPRFSSWFVVGTHRMGLPLPGYPLLFLLPPFLHPASINCPHPSGRGGADAAWSVFLGELKRFD
jgi:hypothetical protein